MEPATAGHKSAQNSSSTLGGDMSRPLPPDHENLSNGIRNNEHILVGNEDNTQGESSKPIQVKRAIFTEPEPGANPDRRDHDVERDEKSTPLPRKVSFKKPVGKVQRKSNIGTSGDDGVDPDYDKPWMQYAVGYPRFAAFMSNDEDKSTTIFRRTLTQMTAATSASRTITPTPVVTGASKSGGLSYGNKLGIGPYRLAWWHIGYRTCIVYLVHAEEEEQAQGFEQTTVDSTEME